MQAGPHRASFRKQRKRAGGGGQGRNDGKYNYSYTDHPVHLCMLSPPLTSDSVLHLHPYQSTEGAQGRGSAAGSEPAPSYTEATSHRHLRLLNFCNVADLKGDELHV